MLPSGEKVVEVYQIALDGLPGVPSLHGAAPAGAHGGQLRAIGQQATQAAQVTLHAGLDGEAALLEAHELAALVSNMPGRGELVRLEECGLAVEPGVEGHLRGVRRLLANRGELPAMGARGRRAVERRYSWEAVQGDLVDFYDLLTRGEHLT